MEQRSFESWAGGTLYLVPTPIGNLEDMTFRAIRHLKEADLILAEDTRNTIKLLNHFEIETPMQSFHEHSQADRLQHLLERLAQGQDLALVSDAGMPLINDPGHPLVDATLSQGLAVVALPGANAALTALIASGLSCQTFTYYGFFPRDKKGQVAVLDLVAGQEATAIFYESPHRIKQALQAIRQELGPDRAVVIARELTKRYETYIRGEVHQVLMSLADQEIKGECVLLVAGGGKVETGPALTAETDLKALVQDLMAQEGLNAKQAIKQVAKTYGLKKQSVYQAYHDLTD